MEFGNTVAAAFAETRGSNSSCGDGEYEVRTFALNGAASDDVSFIILVP